jgi:peptide/nickel transport system ATP-binding protein
MIAMALCCSPALLICDEPTTALDVTVQKTVLELIRSLQKDSGMGVLFITHDLGVVAEIADRAIVMYKGELLESGSVRDIFLHPVHPYTKGLLNCRPILHKKGERLPIVSDFVEGKTPTQKVDSLHLPADTQISKNQQALDQAESVIRLESLNVWYPGRKNHFGKPVNWLKAVNDVSFEIRAGETLGLVGESGSGKSTLGRAILKLIKPSSGKIFFRGRDLAAFNDTETKLFRRNLQIVFQDPYSSLNPRIQIGEAIAEPMKVLHIEQRARWRKEKAIALLEKVDLSADYYHRYPHEFSGGQRQRIVIARALAVDPSFVVFDESVSALDVSVQAQVLNLINDLKREFGFTVVFISHDLSVVNYISDRIVVMNQGKIEESGEASRIFENPQKEYTQKLVASIPKGILPEGA